MTLRWFLGHAALVAGVLFAQTAHSLSVEFSEPQSGAFVSGNVVVSGTSTDADRVELAIDNSIPVPVQGVDSWEAVFDAGDLAPGMHVLRATAIASSGQRVRAFLSVRIAQDPPRGDSVTYFSSIDGTPLDMEIHVPAQIDTPQTALVVHLHGAGGVGTLTQPLRSELDQRGWIGIAPDNRPWALADQGCDWNFSVAYVNSDNPDVGPGEQDVLDAIDWALANYPVDPDRIYLTGFSFGGRGAYIIGLKRPDLFAAIAPMGPASDMFEIFVRRGDINSVCREGITGGQPGDSPRVDTMYKVTSGRFLLENALNLPVYHAHGLADTVTSNTPLESDYLHGWHMTVDTSWDGCFGDTDLCFGHTPTLVELAGAMPDGYHWAFMFTPVGHVTDTRWYTGTPMDADHFGTPDPGNPDRLLGIFDFFAAHTRVDSPDTVVFKTYTDEHRGAYWAHLDIERPWEDAPGAIRATRNVANNAVHLELAYAKSVGIDLVRAGVTLAPKRPLRITLDRLAEPTFDPALLAGDAQFPTVQLNGNFSDIYDVAVWLDGEPLPRHLVEMTDTTISIGPFKLDQPRELMVNARAIARDTKHE